MTTYVILVRLRESQNQSSLRSPSQIVNDTIQKAGGKVVSALATLGYHDLHIVASFPDQASAFRASSSLKMQNGWITETSAAEPLANFDSIYNEVTKEVAGSSTRR